MKIGKAAPSKIVVYILVLIVMGFFLFPVIWAVITSVSPPIESIARPPHWIPQNPTLDNWIRVFNDQIIVTAFTNSLIIVIASVSLNLLLGVLGAYAFARFKFRGRRQFLLLVFGAQMLPVIVFAIPWMIIMISLNLIDTQLGLILLYATLFSPFIVWILESFFEGLPAEVQESAMLDGASNMQILFRIVVPLAAPGIATATMYSFILGWCEFFTPLVLTRTKARTLTVAIGTYIGHHAPEYVHVVTVAVLAFIPVLILAFALQKYFIQGLMKGAIKG